MPDDQTVQDAAAAIRAITAIRPSPEDLARAALSVIPDAILEEAPLIVMTLNRLSDDEAEFTFPGGPRLVLHKGDWVERDRPTRLHVSIMDLAALSAP